MNDYPAICILLRGYSIFATPDLYKQCEENGTSYVIWLKENGILREKASYLVEYAVVYGKFMYKADLWPYKNEFYVSKISELNVQLE